MEVKGPWLQKKKTWVRQLIVLSLNAPLLILYVVTSIVPVPQTTLSTAREAGNLMEDSGTGDGDLQHKLQLVYL